MLLGIGGEKFAGVDSVELELTWVGFVSWVRVIIPYVLISTVLWISTLTMKVVVFL